MKYEFVHAVECGVSRDFAWRFWSEVDNWAAVDPAVESVGLDGPFAAGTKGVTKPRGSEPVGWELSEVRDGRGALITIAAPGAVLEFRWEFEEAAGGGTTITQRVSLEGARAEDYAGAMRLLEDGIPMGMRALAGAMERAAEGAA